MTLENNNNGALSGVKVIDLTRVLSGPFLTVPKLNHNKHVPKSDIKLTSGIPDL